MCGLVYSICTHAVNQTGFLIEGKHTATTTKTDSIYNRGNGVSCVKVKGSKKKGN